jgi:hypothetical protein
VHDHVTIAFAEVPGVGVAALQALAQSAPLA